jgi:3-oxoadipate enol-lactonase
MPFVDAGDLRVRYEWSGPPGPGVLVLSHSLGTDLSMWDPQMPALQERFRVLRYDTRGHGGTAVTEGPYSVGRLAEDVLRMLDALGVARVHFCGLSMGGQIGMWLGSRAPERIERLVLCNTGARIGSAESWNTRIDTVRFQGMSAISTGVTERWFSATFRERAPEVVARAKALLEATPALGYAGCAAAIRDADERAHLGAIRAPTLVIAGSKDPATPPADGRFLADSIPGARYVELEAAHLSSLEAPEAFTSTLVRFLTHEKPA